MKKIIIAADKGRIEISDTVLVDLISRFVRDAVGVSEKLPKNLSENLAGRFGFPERRRGITIRSSERGLIVRLSLQFKFSQGITSFVAELVEGIDQLLQNQLGIPVAEVHVEVVGGS
ncbi:MAG: Asp23/Gls24 family envelope stress response protein [Symbiobacteriaceae bacterium]|nr:Asp23/Gls24 family envelope stress response protein [Symbiobacteriaceae bacterium]